MDKENTVKIGGFGKLLIIVFIIAYTLVVVRCAWLGDDAYITYRVVDNFVKGYGLVWNIDERVQVYTHPLWMFLVASVYRLSGNIYYTAIYLSLALSVLAVSLYAFTIPRSALTAVLGISALTLSKAYTDYSTSGLENPLTNLLLVIFFYIYLRKELNIKRFFLLSLIAALGTLNRMDTLLLFLPVLAFTFWKMPVRLKAVKALISGFIPFFAWEIFSLFYYGFPFPNTAYAKLNTGIPTIKLVRQGFYYLQDSILTDPVTQLVIFSSILAVVIKKRWNHIPLITAMVLYMLYTIKIGGCFMSGRYYSGVLLIAVIVIGDTCFKSFSKSWVVSMIILLIMGLTPLRSPIFSNIDYGENFGVMYPHNISDERGFYYPETGLLRVLKGLTPDPSGTATKTLNLEKIYKSDQSKDHAPGIASLPFIDKVKSSSVDLQMVIGRLGFAVGPGIHILDIVALADPLLSRLPTINKENFWIGHFKRRVPEGYYETLKTGKNCIKDPDIALFYHKLSLIIKGELFDSRRIAEILKMNLGLYNYLIVDTYTPPKLKNQVPDIIKLGNDGESPGLLNPVNAN